MSFGNETSAIVDSSNLLDRILSLPHELLRSLLSAIANFEPWTHSSTLDQAGSCITDKDLPLHSRGAIPLRLLRNHIHDQGLSSESGWLMLVLSRHPFHLSQNDKAGISATITQALRRMNVQVERMCWNEAGLTPNLQGSTAQEGINVRKQDQSSDEASQDRIPSRVSMKQYHATVQPEEDSCNQEPKTGANHDVQPSSPSLALIRHTATPLLILGHHDILHIAHQRDFQNSIKFVSALLVAVLVWLVQCRSILIEITRKLDCDTPLPTSEPCDTKDVATLKLSPRRNRMRSLSGSTVAEVPPHESSLSLSAISTVYSLGDSAKKMKWAEKRMTEEEHIGVLSKRPKLGEYKQVSSGRVASLMDKFEKFHI